MPSLDEIAIYATGIGFNDKALWNYTTNTATPLLRQMRDRGLIVHIWTFKDDILMFNSKNNIVDHILCRICMKLGIKC